MAKKASSPPAKPTIVQRLDAIGIEALCGRIECGESMREIARSLVIPVSELSKWLNRSDEASKRSARAKEASAEAWLDRGLEAIERAMDKEGSTDAAAAKAYAQECARRAALRNPAYRDKQEVNLSGGLTVKKSAADMTDDELLAIATGSKVSKNTGLDQ